MRPNFFIVGAPKCGTTSLHEYLRQHPDVFMPENKEPKFFCTDLYYQSSHIVDGEEAYFALFEPAGDARAVGEASAGYLYSQVAHRKIKAFNPEARIIISLRNPVDMMYSNHRHLVSIGHQDLEDFEQALASEEARSRTNEVPPFCHVPPQFLRYRWMSTYSPHVQKYLDTFGRQRVHVLLFEDLVQRPEQTYCQILSFLGVEPGFVPEFRAHNVTADKSSRNLALRRFYRSHRRLRLATKFVRRVAWPLFSRISIGKLLVPLFNEVDFPGQVDPELRRRLLREHRPEIDRLARLLDRDLSIWDAPPAAAPAAAGEQR
jgi:hypothetical protein